MSVYAVSDLHGNHDIYKAIKNFLKQEDRIICLGDCGDRGMEPWKTIVDIASDDQFTYLMGNHEHMLVGAMCEYLDDSRLSLVTRWYSESDMRYLLANNGGEGTFQGWIDGGANQGWINYLLHLPTYMDYINKDGVTIHLSHAGYNPICLPDNNDLIWDRSHMKSSWPDNHDKEIIIHGHTPCPFLNRNWKPKDGAIWYCDNHKVDIDVGSYATNIGLLLDLDTFEEHIIEL